MTNIPQCNILPPPPDRSKMLLLRGSASLARLRPASRASPARPARLGAALGRWAKGVRNSWGHCNLYVFLQRDLLGIPVNLLLFSKKCQGVPFSPNPSKFITLSAAPLVLTPFVCNQGAARRGPGARPLRHGHVEEGGVGARGAA